MSSILHESQNFDNEVVFCNILSQRDKKELERIFLKNRISYYIDWQNQSLWQKLFARKGSDRINCFVKINRSEVEKAYGLVKNIKGLKFKDITGDTERRAVTKRALMDEAEDLDDEERD